MEKTINRNSSQRHLVLILPGLTRKAGFKAPETPTRLEWLLGRADRLPQPATDFEACLFRLFGVAREDDRDLPVAAVTRVRDMGVVDNAWWIRADPVHLVPQGDSLVMAASDELAIEQPEADRLVREILEVFADDGWVLKAPRPTRWYLQPVEPPRIQTTSVGEVLGHDIYPALPRGADGKKWHTVLNELQILLHTASVNVEREARGLATINSLWFWGGGRMPVLKESDWTRLWSNELIGSALARLAQVASSPRPSGAEQWLTEAGAGNHVVILDQALEALRHGRQERWQDFVARLDTQWTRPLLEALRSDALQSLTVYLEGCPPYRIEARGLRRWWRRRKSLGSLAC